jgi:hypothetical protein
MNRTIVNRQIDDYTAKLGAYDASVLSFNSDLAKAEAGTAFAVEGTTPGTYGVTNGKGDGGLALKGDYQAGTVVDGGKVNVGADTGLTLLKAPTQPVNPRFTTEQLKQHSNPTATAAQAAVQAPSRLTQNNDWRPLGDPNDGILQRALKGQV